MAVEKVKITGVKFFQGSIDGKDIDSGTIFVEEMLDFTTGRAKGYATQAYKAGKASVSMELMNRHEFPLIAEVEFMRVTNGNETKNVIANVTALPHDITQPKDKKVA
jgi:hypothetical protein